MQPRTVSLPTTSSVATRQQLHTAFWAHGAASIELFDACQALMGTAMDAGPKPSSDRGKPIEKRPDSLTASAFVLDFLYPNGAGALLRSLSPRILDRYERPPQYNMKDTVLRLHHSSSVAAPTNNPSAEERETPNHNLPGSELPGHPTKVSEVIGSLDFDSVPGGDRRAAAQHDSYGLAAEVNQYSKYDTLRELLASGEVEMTDRVWNLYGTLPRASKSDFRIDLLRYLGKSDRAVDAWKAKELFSELDSGQWTEGVVSTAIKANLTLNNPTLASQIFSEAMDLKGFSQGLDLLLAYALRVSSWSFALEIWGMFRRKFNAGLPSPTSFEWTAAVPDLSNKLSRLYDYVDTQIDPDGSRDLTHEVNDILTYISTDTLAPFRPADAVSILDRVGTYSKYEEFIDLCMERGQKKLAGRMYWRYRKLPDVRIRVFVLRHMLNVFYPRDVRGMEQVLKDWYQRYDHLDSFAYHKFLSFYAGRGDTKTVTRLWDEYKKHYHNAKKDRAALSALMHAYAVRGEVENAREALDSSCQEFGREPGTIEWNILLNAHAKAWDFEGATSTFAEICEAGKADVYSFGTFMGMAGSRGDVHMCLDLYKTAKEMNIEADATMLDSLVEAYCQNDQFAEAEHLCVRITKEKRVKGNYTLLWNTLLVHYAYRRDLSNVNRVLERMAELNITYDSQTYEHLLQALVYCRQSHHALQLIRVALEEHVFEPTLNHYLLLMSAFLRTREPHMALKLGEMIKHMDNLGTANRVTKIIDALGRWQQIPEKLRQEKGAEYYVQAAFQVFQESLGREKRTARDDRRSTSRQYSLMIFLLTQMRDFASVKQLVDLYKKEFPKDSSPQTLPLKLLSSIMLSDFYENKFDEVKATWTLILERAKPLGSPSSTLSREGPDGVPSRCYILSDPLKTMQRVYLAEKDPDGLLKMVAQVRELGFELDSKNWNYHVQALARLKRWKEAFSICEEVLMPQWTGWKRVRMRENVKNQLPLEMRRLGSSPRYLRPIAYTLILLAREYMELEKLTPWSLEAAKLFNMINEDCARVVRAVHTMVRTGTDDENRIFDEGQVPMGEFHIGAAGTGTCDVVEDDKSSPAKEKQGRPLAFPKRG